MAYDPENKAVILYGGDAPGTAAGPGTALGDTWIWNGAGWALPPKTSAPSPPPLSGAALAYDGHRHLVLFGGQNGQTQSRETWLWDGKTKSWAVATPATSPPARTRAGVAYDELANKVVLFGGTTLHQGPPGATASASELGDTWTWDGQTWTQTQDAAAGPGNRKSVAMAYDAVSRSVVLFGGSCSLGPPTCLGSSYSSETWTWTSAGWTHRNPKVDTSEACGLNGNPAPTTLPSIDDAAMYYDPFTRKIIMFGGYANQGLQGWFPGSPGSPPPSDQDTWIFDSSFVDRTTDFGSWKLLDCAAGTFPPGRQGAATAIDPASHRVMLFGGLTLGSALLNDTWLLSLSLPAPPATTTTTSTTKPATTTSSTLAPPAPRPIVHSVLPVSGPMSGGTPVAIAGSGVTAATKVSFEDFVLDCARPNTCVVDKGDLHVTSPPHGAGTVDVRVTTATGTSEIVRDPVADDDRFTYFPATPLPNTAPFGASGIVNSPFQPSQPAPPGGFGSAPVPGGFGSAPVPGGFSSAPVPGSFGPAPAPGALPAASASGSALPAPGAPPSPPGAPQGSGPVRGFVPLGPAPPVPVAGIPPDPTPGPWPAPYFNMAVPARDVESAISRDTIALAAAASVILCCFGYARRRPAPETAPRGRSAPQQS